MYFRICITTIIYVLNLFIKKENVFERNGNENILGELNNINLNIMNKTVVKKYAI